MRRLALIAVAIALTACSAAGAKFAEIQPPALPEDRGRLYILRERQVLYSIMPVTIGIDGQTIGTLRNGGFLTVDLPAGPKTITARALVSRVTARFDLEPARTVYVSLWAQPTGLPPPRGAIGLQRAYPMINETGLFSMAFLDESSAKAKLANLSLSDGCGR
jgi:hypothetical protein